MLPSAIFLVAASHDTASQSPVQLGKQPVPLIRGWLCDFNSVGWECLPPTAEGNGVPADPNQKVKGSIVGWAMHVGVGIPAQKQKLTIDTGSADLWITAAPRGSSTDLSSKKLRGSAAANTNADNVCRAYPEPNQCLGIAPNKTCFTAGRLGEKPVKCTSAGGVGYDYHTSITATIVEPYTFRGGYGTDSNCSKGTYDFLTDASHVDSTTAAAMKTYLAKPGKMKTGKDGSMRYPKSCPYGGLIVRDIFTPVADIDLSNAAAKPNIGAAGGNSFMTIAEERAAAELRAGAMDTGTGTDTGTGSRRRPLPAGGFGVDFQALTAMPPGQAGGMGKNSNGLVGLDRLSAIGPHAGMKRGALKQALASGTSPPVTNDDGITRFTLHLPGWKPQNAQKEPSAAAPRTQPATLYLGPPPRAAYSGAFFDCMPIANVKDTLTDVWTVNIVGFMTSDSRIMLGVFNTSASTNSMAGTAAGGGGYILLNADRPDDNVAVVDSGTSSTLIPKQLFDRLRDAYHSGNGGVPRDIDFVFALQGARGGYRNVTIPVEQFVAPPAPDAPLSAEDKAMGILPPAEMKAWMAKRCETDPKMLCTPGRVPLSLAKNDMSSMGSLLGVQWVTALVHQFDFTTGRVSIADFA